MRSIFTSEDIKNIMDIVFNGNLWLSKASNGTIPYENPNSQQITLTDAETEESRQVDLAEYLNIKFYTWKQRLVSKDTEGYEGGDLSVFEDWLASLNFSMNEAYALVEKVDEEVISSQDIDGATITGKATFIVQTDKVANLDYYVAKVRNSYVGNPQDLQNAYGENLKAYINIGALLYEQEPITMQLGECVVVSLNFSISYMADALTYNDCEIQISLDGDDEYDEYGEIVGDTKYLTMPITKTTWQNIFTSKPLPTAKRPDLTGFVASSLSVAKTMSFFDFNKTLTNRFNELFWTCSCYRKDGVVMARRDVNIPVYVRVITGGHSYVYKDMIDNMQKTLTNNDFNISSITLKGWGKMESL